jgi:acetyl esterase/lipase
MKISAMKWMLVAMNLLLAGDCLSAPADDRKMQHNLELVKQFGGETNIVYKTVNGEALDMILFLPKLGKQAKSPVMLYTHGGGWGGGDKYAIFGNPFQETLKRLLENGIACATIEYRVTREGISTAFDCVVDCKDAARFLMKNAERYGLDPDRIGVWGGSAGGHLSLMTALADNALFPGDEALKGYNPKFRCVASYFPATTFEKPELLKGSNFERPQRFIPLVGGLPDEKRDLVKLLSPVTHLKKDSPPILLLHGDKDTVLPISLSTYFIGQANELGADARLLTVKNGGHSFNGGPIDPTMPEINRFSAEFIIKHLAK